MVDFAVEPVQSWSADADALIYAHWQELGLDLDLEIAPDFEKMKILEKLGMFKVLTARSEGRLVGYLLAVINAHLHYRTSAPMFIVDAYYIAPEHRDGTGARMMYFAESIAKSIGAIKIYTSCKVHRDHSKLFLALGYRLSDYAFTKRI